MQDIDARAILETATDGLVVYDPDFRFEWLNRTSEQLLDLQRGAVLHRSQWEVFPETIGTELERQFQHAMSERVPAVFESYLEPLKKWFEVRVAPASSGGLEAWFKDITRRKEEEERSRHSQRLESIGVLAGGLAHDFNNLLVGVLGNASLAVDLLPPGDEISELVKRVVEAGEKAARLTRQMLAYAGKGRPGTENVNLAELVRGISALVEASVSKRIAFQYEFDEDLPSVAADPGQLQQVAMNLVMNAAEAIGDRAGRVTIKTLLRDAGADFLKDAQEGTGLEPGVFVCLQVSDTGCGMDEATKARIFDPFFTTKPEGRGLGLAAVAGIVKSHQGALKVQSTPGEGTTFTILFPANIPAPRRLEALALQPSGTADGVTVLVVDDEEEVRGIFGRALQRFGCEVLIASTREAAVELLRQESARISIAILDSTMPGMSVPKVLEEFESVRPGLRVIVSSGYPEDQALESFAGHTVDGFLQKPFTIPALAEVLTGALGGHPAQRTSPEVRVRGASNGHSARQGKTTQPAHALLPAEMVEEIKQAAARADIFRLTDLGRRASAYDPHLGDRMLHLAADFDYDAISRLLEGR